MVYKIKEGIIGLVLITILLIPSHALSTTVMEVARELACPCDCPLVLEDCNMSCGLQWKNEIGSLIAQGKSKEEIIDYFIKKYGEEARLTPLQKLHGKIYQYTRGFDKTDWAIAIAGGILWVLILSGVIYIAVVRFVRRR